VNQGATVTINLTNTLPVPVSLVVDGIAVTATAVSGTALPGVLTKEVPADNGATTVQYQFTASQPGTYLITAGPTLRCRSRWGFSG